MTTHIGGNYHEMLVDFVERQSYPLSFLSDRWTDVSAWQSVGRRAVMSALGTLPQDVPFNASIDSQTERGGVVIERVSYDQSFGPRTQGFFLYPANAQKPLPGVMALHDHGAFKYFGKEKLVALDGEPKVLTEFKTESYEGQSWATRLALRGYAVFVPDLFLWGSRRIDPNTVPPEFTRELAQLQPGSGAYIRAYNDFSGGYETLIAKSLFLAGASWAGVMVYEDRRALDYFLSRSLIDPQRVACGGLSCGGLRSVYLAALDPRIRCMFTAGFMATNTSIVADRVQYHTWMFHVPALAGLLDFPDILSLMGPAPCLALYNTDDPLWTLQGQQDAHEKLGNIFKKFQAPERYTGRFYPGVHKFDCQMQADAFAFLDSWLLN